MIATGQPYLANFESPELSGIVDPIFLAFAKATGMRATCVVPLVARGRTIGAMGAIQAESGRQYSAEDGVLLGELAQRAALALDNVRLFAEAQAALHEAEIANRAKDDFLAMLGHELRNPLAPIVTSLGVMARRYPQAAAPQRLVIERQVAHLSRLVDDLLDVSRIASGKIRLNLERLDLRTVVERALELVEPALETRARRPDVTLPDEPVWVKGDALRLAQIVGNLLTNAAKFSRVEDRIAIELRVERRRGASDRHRRRRRHRRRSCWRACSSGSCRASRRCSAPKAGSASASRSRRAWSSCTTAPSAPRATARAGAAASP